MRELPVVVDHTLVGIVTDLLAEAASLFESEE